MKRKDAIELSCSPWEVPKAPPPTNPVVVNISVVRCCAVLKNKAIVRIKSILPKPESIVIQPEALVDYHTFSVNVKSITKSLDVDQNVLYFSDLFDEHRFLFDIQCVWAAMFQKNEISMVAVTLHADLVKRSISWKKLSPAVIGDLAPLPEEPNKQSIASMQAVSSVERRHHAIDLINEEEGMDFAGPIYRRNQNETVCTLTVWKRYAPLLLSLNSLLFTIDNQFRQIGRTTPVDEKVVTEICSKILEVHSNQNNP